LENKFDEWAILELMGHRRLAGKVSEAAIGGGSFIRIDMPMKDGSTSTQFYSPASIYCITPTTEKIAREVALASQPEPVNRWEFKQLTEPERPAIDPLNPPDGLDEQYDGGSEENEDEDGD
jgi:hypothetical protein